MKMPPDYRPREGDVLTVHAVVDRDVRPDEDEAWVKIEGHYGRIHIKLDDIAGVHCRHWSEGEKVCVADNAKKIGVVVGTHNDQVWVDFGTAVPQTYHANSLVPAVEEAKPEPDDDWEARSEPPPAGPASIDNADGKIAADEPKEPL